MFSITCIFMVEIWSTRKWTVAWESGRSGEYWKLTIFSYERSLTGENEKFKSRRLRGMKVGDSSTGVDFWNWTVNSNAPFTFAEPFGLYSRNCPVFAQGPYLDLNIHFWLVVPSASSFTKITVKLFRYENRGNICYVFDKVWFRIITIGYIQTWLTEQEIFRLYCYVKFIGCQVSRVL